LRASDNNFVAVDSSGAHGKIESLVIGASRHRSASYPNHEQKDEEDGANFCTAVLQHLGLDINMVNSLVVALRSNLVLFRLFLSSSLLSAAARLLLMLLTLHLVDNIKQSSLQAV
jgi:hypothetical protein